MDEKIFRFSKGFAKVQDKKGKWNIMDENGKFVLDENWVDYISSFLYNYAIIRNNKKDIILSQRMENSYLRINGIHKYIVFKKDMLVYSERMVYGM